MIQMPDPDESDAGLIAVDQALDALARRRPTVPDPALAALAEFAREIDARAAALDPRRAAGLNGEPASVHGPSVRPFALDAVTMPPVARHTRTRPDGRRRLSRAVLAASVAAGAVVAAGALPISGSPGSPLYPLHQLIFQPDRPTTAQDVRLSLASASQALDRATSSNGSTRAADLDQARRRLAEAREQLAHVTDADTRSELETELSNLERRAARLADDTNQHGGPADTARAGQDGQHGDGGHAGTASPTNDSQNGQAQPTATAPTTDNQQ